MLTKEIGDLAIRPRRRAAAEGREVAVAAQMLTGAFRDRLTAWYPRLAYLRARAMRDDLVIVRPEARSLLVEVIRARKQLDECTEATSELTQSHSIVRDLQRAFRRLEDELRGLGGVTRASHRR